MENDLNTLDIDDFLEKYPNAIENDKYSLIITSKLMAKMMDIIQNKDVKVFISFVNKYNDDKYLAIISNGFFHCIDYDQFYKLNHLIDNVNIDKFTVIEACNIAKRNNNTTIYNLLTTRYKEVLKN